MKIDQDNQRTRNRQSTNDYYRVLNAHTGEPLGRLIDISQSGFRIISAEDLELGEYDSLIHLPRLVRNVREIPIQVTLKWCEHNRRFDWYEAGFAIDSITDHARELLEQIIKEISSVKPVR
jgi:hypothetical protein